MNLKPKNNSAWHEWINRKFVAVYFALALVLVINQIVFAVLLTDREKAKAFDSSADAGYVQSITNLGNQTVVAGATDVTLAEFFMPDSTYFNENVACNGRITGNSCLTMLDSDGAATTTAGPGDDDGYDYIWQLEPDSKIKNTYFTNTDKVCVNTLDAVPTCIYIDKTDGTVCTDGATADVYILGVGCALGTDVIIPSGGRLMHSEKVAANAVYDFCDPALDPGCGTLETETIWYSSAWIDTLVKNHTCDQKYDQIVDCDGIDNTGRGECEPISYGDPLVAFNGTEQLCTNSLTSNPNCLYVEPDLVTSPLPANCPALNANEFFLRGLGCGGVTAVPVGTNWSFRDSDNSGNWSLGEDIYYNYADPNGNPGTTYDGEVFPGITQGAPFSTWSGTEGFFDANANGWFDGSDIVLIDNDSDFWYTSGIDTDVYSEAGGLAGDGATEAIIYFNTPGGYGENGFNLFFADFNDPGLECSDVILEDTGNIQGGPGSISAPNGNGVIDTIFENWNVLALKNIGTALANRDITNVRIYNDAWYSFCFPGPCPPTDGHCTGPSSPEDKFWATMNMNDNLWISNNNENTQSSYIFARACIVADIPATAINGKTIQIQLPKLKDNNSNGLYNYGDEGLFVYSSNDGLTGSDPYNFPYTLTVSSMNFESVSGPTDSTPAGEVQSLGITADSSGTVTLNWIDPTADDLKEIIVTEISAGVERINIVSKGVQNLVLTGRLISSKYIYKVQSRDVNGLESVGLEREIIIPATGKVSAGDVGQTLPAGVNVGDLIKSSDSARVYYLGDDKKLHWFANETIFRSWYPDFNKVKTISKENMLFLSVGNDVYLRPGTYLVKKATDSKVYAIEPGGVLRWIKNEQIATSLYGAGWNSKIKDLSDNVIDAYTQGMAIDTVSHPTGSLISYPDKPTVYYIDMGKKRAITNSVFLDSRYQNIFVTRNISPDIKYEDGILMDAISEVGYWQ